MIWHFIETNIIQILVIDPTQQDLATRQGAGSDITFGENYLIAVMLLIVELRERLHQKATTQNQYTLMILMAGRVDANGNPTIGQAYAGLIPGQNSDLESAYSFQGKCTKT